MRAAVAKADHRRRSTASTLRVCQHPVVRWRQSPRNPQVQARGLIPQPTSRCGAQSCCACLRVLVRRCSRSTVRKPQLRAAGRTGGSISPVGPDLVARAPLLFHPGSSWRYSYSTVRECPVKRVAGSDCRVNVCRTCLVGAWSCCRASHLMCFSMSACSDR